MFIAYIINVDDLKEMFGRFGAIDKCRIVSRAPISDSNVGFVRYLSRSPSSL